jgi:hypothetical protein
MAAQLDLQSAFVSNSRVENDNDNDWIGKDADEGRRSI